MSCVPDCRLRLLPALLAGALALIPVHAAQAAPVLLISLDGLRPGDVLDAEARGLVLPNLRRFLVQGSHARAVQPVTPSLTYPNHTTMITGTEPDRHGIVSNLTFDPFARNERGWAWYTEDVKVATLWDAAARQHLSTANIHWPVSVGAHVDSNLPQIWRTGTPDDAKLLRALGTPGLQVGLESELGPYADGIDESMEGDENRARFAVRVLEERKPWFVTAYFTALDHTQHEHGPGSPEAHQVLTHLDAIVGRLVEAERKVHPDAVIAVASDHGFAPVHTDINLFRAFIDAGLVHLEKGKVVSWDAAPWYGAGSAAVILRNPGDDAVRKRVEILLDTLRGDAANGIQRVLGRKEIAQHRANPQADYWIDFSLGYEMGTDPAAPMVAPSRVKGMHGYASDLPEMQATFLVMGPGVPAGRDLGQIHMRDIAPTLAHLLEVSLPAAEGTDLLR